MLTDIRRMDAGASEGTLLYAEVDISIIDILQFNSVAKVLLTAPTLPNSYYDIERVNVEYTHVATVYTITPNDAIFIGMDSIGTGQGTCLSALILSTASDSVACGFNLNPVGIDPATNLSVMQFSQVQKPLIMGTLLGDPTLGDGTMKVKIWYYLRFFG